MTQASICTIPAVKAVYGQKRAKAQSARGKFTLTEGATAVLQLERDALSKQGIEMVEHYEKTNQVALYQAGAFDLIERVRIWSLPESPHEVPVLNWWDTEGVLTVRTDDPTQREVGYLVVRTDEDTFELRGRKNGRSYDKIVYRQNPLEGSFPFSGKAVRYDGGWIIENLIGNAYLIEDGRIEHPRPYLRDYDFGRNRLEPDSGAPDRFVLRSKESLWLHSRAFVGRPRPLDKHTLIAQALNGSSFFLSRKKTPEPSALEFDGEPDDWGSVWAVRQGDDMVIVRKHDFAQSRAFKRIVRELGDLLLVEISPGQNTFISKRRPDWEAGIVIAGDARPIDDAWLFKTISDDFFMMRQRLNGVRSPPLDSPPEDLGLSYLSRNAKQRNFLFQKRNFAIVSDDFSGEPKDYGRTFLLSPWTQWKKRWTAQDEKPPLRLVPKNNVGASQEFYEILEGERSALDVFRKKPFRLWLKVLGEESKIYWLNTQNLMTSDEPPGHEEQTYRE